MEGPFALRLILYLDAIVFGALVPDLMTAFARDRRDDARLCESTTLDQSEQI